MQTQQPTGSSAGSGSSKDVETPSASNEDPSGTQQSKAEQLKDLGRDSLKQGKQAAADQADTVADALKDTADRLGERNASLAEYAQRLSEGVAQMADHVRHRSLDELTADAQALARRNPAVFLIGSVAVGLALSRFMKARGERSGDSESEPTRH
jgi:hypothetical protein